MLRLSVSQDLSAWIACRAAAYVAKPSEQIPVFADGVGILPLYAGWFETIGLRADGEVISWSTEGEYVGTKSVRNRYHWLTALVFAAQRYPELLSLIPARPPDARDCDCTAPPLSLVKKWFCPECCDLGWLAPESHIKPGTRIRLIGCPVRTRKILKVEWHYYQKKHVYIVETSAPAPFEPYWFAEQFILES